ncbi:alpha/beta fold hydrolase [Aeromicrobium sp. CTD01-1L150]|uniref:alpha/beta fold hydrolase n=1 Tax=Aeromicrobium sp. CTD01-1L150 TaxID=3341830 RepID=UPI0035C12FEB
MHELGGGLESWQALADMLADQVRVVRFDQRGSGGSYSPVEAFTTDDLVDDLEAVVAKLGIDHPVHLVGAAFGAAQCISYAARHPDAVASLTLLAPALSVSTPSAAVMRERAAGALAGGMASIETLSLDRSWPPDRRTDRFDDYRQRFLTTDPRGYAWAHEAMTATDVHGELAGLRVSTLVMAGSHDVVRPPTLLREEFAASASAQVVEIDASHFLAVENPRAVVDHLARFLDLPPRQSGLERPVHRDGDPLDTEQRAAVQEAIDGTRGRMPEPMRAWIQSPELARRAQSLGETLRYHTSLEPRLSELAVITTARLWRSEYEWCVHAPLAEEAGIAATAVESLRGGRRPRGLLSDEAVIVDLCVALHCERRVSDPLFDRASRTLGAKALAEVVGILGYYTLVSMTLNTYRLGEDAAPSPFPDV